jgi:hypothetical protein
MSSSAAPAAATVAGAIWRSPAGARMPRAIAGARLSICAIWPRARSGPPRISPPCAPRKATKPSSRRRARSSATSCRPRSPHRDQRVAGRRRGVAAHHDHQSLGGGARHRADQLRGGGARESRPRTRRIPPSAISSCKRSSCRPSSPCSAPAGPVPGGEAAVAAASDGGAGGEPGAVSCETDRSRFVGRGGTLAHPAAMQTLALVQHRRVRARSHRRAAAHGHAAAPKPPSWTWFWA